MKPQDAATPPDAIVAISSHVARGTVGNRASAHAIEALGHPVWSIPTVMLPWHPGQGPGTRAAWPDGSFSDLLSDLAGSDQLREVGAVISGYLGSASQAEPIARLVHAAKAKRRAIYCCDPVIGNQRGRYVPEATAEAIRDVLVPLADIITPNRFELGWLTDREVGPDHREAVEIARSLPPPIVLITSARVEADEIDTLLVTPNSSFIARHRRIDAPNAGTGDLTAALFLARVLEGEPPERALRAAVAGALEAVVAEAKLGADELPLERIHPALRKPKAPVHIERLP